MRTSNFGSLNVDRAYQVEHSVRKGKAILAGEHVSNIGRKRLDQFIALAGTGTHMIRAGTIGPDDTELKMTLEADGVDTSHIMQVPGTGGHTVIRIANGENSIIVYGGANRTIDHVCVYKVLNELGPDDLLLVRNEIPCVPHIMKQAEAYRMKVAVNASPVTAELLEHPLGLADYIIVNEQEERTLADGSSVPYKETLDNAAGKYRTTVLLTAGDKGICYRSDETQYYQPVIKANAVDITGAGDTSYGYFLTGLGERTEPGEILKVAAAAAATAVSRPGVLKSVP